MRIMYCTLLLGLVGAMPLLAATTTYSAAVPTGEPIAVTALIAAGEAHVGKTVLASGRITQVCQNAGCWLMLEANGEAVRVKTQHQFFVPKDAAGTAVVQGEWQQVSLTEAQAAHFAAEQGIDAAAAPRREWQILASSISITATAAPAH